MRALGKMKGGRKTTHCGKDRGREGERDRHTLPVKQKKKQKKKEKQRVFKAVRLEKWQLDDEEALISKTR